MKKGTKRNIWKIALLAGLAVGLLTASWADDTQSRLASHVLRLHVVANSDSEADQAQKLRVRDAVLAAAEPLLEGCSSSQEAEAVLRQSCEEIEQTARALLQEEGSDYGIQVSFEETWFPTKSYGGLSLPQGRYRALRVVIGEGAGQNWWCVVFPPLCLVAAEDTAQQALSAGLTEGDVALVTDGDYTLKFKVVELWEAWKEKLMG